MSKDFFTIDIYNLDIELQEQSDRHRRYCEDLAVAKDVLARAEAKVKVVKSEVLLEVRTGFDLFGFSKMPTAPETEATVLTEPRYKKVIKDVHEASHTVDMHWALVNASSQRKDSISDLVKLHGQQYWSVPTVVRTQQETGPALNPATQKKRKKSNGKKEGQKGKA